MPEDAPPSPQSKTTNPPENYTPNGRSKGYVHVEINRREPITPLPDNQLITDNASAFWLKVEQLRGVAKAKDLEDYRRRLKNRFTWELARLVNSELPAGQPRIVFTVEDIDYPTLGTLKFKLFIENIDSLLAFIGNNADLIEGVLAHHIPPAFARAYGVSETDNITRNFDVAFTVPPELAAHAHGLASRSGARSSASSITKPSRDLDVKEKARLILQRIMASTLLLPVLMIIYLWYLTRQDAAHDREIVGQILKQNGQHVNDVLKSLVQHQTETLRSLEAAAISRDSDTCCCRCCCCCTRRPVKTPAKK